MGRLELITSAEGDKLFDYQIPDVEKSLAALDSRGYVLNANRPGYGKTIEALATFRAANLKSLLVICPKSVTLQWALQIKKWLDIPVAAQCLNPGPQAFSAVLSSRVVIVKYDTLARGCMHKEGRRICFSLSAYLEMFKNRVWDMIICDEVHRIKNHQRARSWAVKQLPSVTRMGLTGTPILKHPDDLYSILEWLENGSGNGMASHGYWKFCYRYCNVTFDGFGNKPTGLTKNTDRVQELKDNLEPFTVRNPEMQYGEGKQSQVVTLELAPVQRRMYNKMREAALDDLPDNCTMFNGMMKSLRMRQLCSNPTMFDRKFLCAKTQYIRDCLEIDEDAKIVVFSVFAETVKNLAKALGKQCIVYIGDMNEREREEAKKRFTSDRNVRILAGTIGAMSEGVDGLQYACNEIIFFDRDFNPGVNEQAEDRVYRSGQRKRVMVTYLEYPNTIEQKVRKINEGKEVAVRELFV